MAVPTNLKENEMTVKKVTAKKPAKPGVTKTTKTTKAAKSTNDQQQTPAPSSPTETKEHKEKVTKSAKPKTKVSSPDAIRTESMKPALEAKLKQDAVNRSEMLVETGLLVIDPKDAKIPLEVMVHNAAVAKDVPAGLVEYQVQGTHLTLLAPEDANAELSLAQRFAMAKRLNEVGPKLPKYIKTVEVKKPDFFNAEIEAKKAASQPQPATTSDGKTSTPASTIPNGVPLKKICADINIDPKLARRILRSKGKKPGGRWEWKQEEVAGVKKFLADEAKKLAEASKE